MVDTITLVRPGSIKLWFSRYLPMTVVPERSKFTVAMSEGTFRTKAFLQGNIADNWHQGID